MGTPFDGGGREAEKDWHALGPGRQGPAVGRIGAPSDLCAAQQARSQINSLRFNIMMIVFDALHQLCHISMLAHV